MRQCSMTTIPASRLIWRGDTAEVRKRQGTWREGHAKMVLERPLYVYHIRKHKSAAVAVRCSGSPGKGIPKITHYSSVQ